MFTCCGGFGKTDVVSSKAPGIPVNGLAPWAKRGMELSMLRLLPNIQETRSRVANSVGDEGEEILAADIASNLFPEPPTKTYDQNDTFNMKVSLWSGDITNLAADVIVNAANTGLLADGGGLNAQVHKRAGTALEIACKLLAPCSPGGVVATHGFELPAQLVFHAVAPSNQDKKVLSLCYWKCLEMLVERKHRSIAIPCLGTGTYMFPQIESAHVALSTIRTWLETPGNADLVDRIIIVTKTPYLEEVYEQLTEFYFPTSSPPETSVQEERRASAILRKLDSAGVPPSDAPGKVKKSKKKGFLGF